MEGKPSISVVVCTKDRPEHIKKCLRSLLEQPYPPKEIIIVDDGSKEKISGKKLFRDLVEKFRIKLHAGIEITIIRNRKNFGTVVSRNVGIVAATGDIVAFLDDDGFAHKEWLENLAKNYRNKKIAGVGGPVIEIGREMETPRKPVKKPAYIRMGKIVSHYRIKGIGDAKYLPRKFVPFLQGGNMSFRREVLVEAKGADINIIGNYYREETDICLSVAKKGKLLFEPTAVTYHDTAKSGGSRDIIKSDLDMFLYYMFRNTTYFFFKHFKTRKAANFTMQSINRQMKLLKKGRTGLTRDYLKTPDKRTAFIPVLIGALDGFSNWFRARKNEADMVYGRPAGLQCFKLVRMGRKNMVEELGFKARQTKKLFGM